MLFLFLLKFTILDLFIIFITAHRKASFASIVYASLLAAYPSVCPSVPSVTLRYYVKTRECRRMQSLPLGRTVPLVFWCQEWLMGGWPCPGKSWVQRGRPLWKHARWKVMRRNVYRNISPHNFPKSNQPRPCVTPNFPKMVFVCPNLSFFRRNFDDKPLQVCRKVSFCQTASSGKVVAQNLGRAAGTEPQ